MLCSWVIRIVCQLKQHIGVTWLIDGTPAGKIFASQFTYLR